MSGFPADLLPPPVPVSIVGAGPGDPELLTCRAVKRLEAAHLVLYDGLVPAAIYRVARHAHHLSVSRRPGDRRVSPGEVAALMIDAARRQLRVVRLRAGDPLVLARGAEEAQALAAAGVPFEIVPGLTTASAAATLAGIPLTHRGVVSGFTVVSGHAAGVYGPVLRSQPANGITVVVLMGLAHRDAIAKLLLESGWRRNTPAAIVLSASQPEQQVWRGTLETVPTSAVSSSPDSPGVIIIGDVVAVRDVLVTVGDPAGRHQEEHTRRQDLPAAVRRRHVSYR